jgi:hypothetical protein
VLNADLGVPFPMAPKAHSNDHRPMVHMWPKRPRANECRCLAVKVWERRPGNAQGWGARVGLAAIDAGSVLSLS